VCDAYVSLHRAEGLGLTMAEAMAEGKPVIATGYSGNLEFMDDDVAFLVRSNLEPIGLGVDPYPPDARWAEPDLEHAAAQMRRVFDDREHAAQVGRRAADRIQSQWSSDAVAPRLAELVEQVRARPRDPEGHWRGFFMRGWRNRVRRLPFRAYASDWLADGFPLDPSVHRLLRSCLPARLMPPDPDGEDATERMVKWLNTPVAPRRRSFVSRYLVQYWHDHPELQERFPAVESDRGQAAAYVDWITECWHTDTAIDYRLVPQG
jgi:Glycosyl transferases group 1